MTSSMIYIAFWFLFMALAIDILEGSGHSHSTSVKQHFTKLHVCTYFKPLIQTMYGNLNFRLYNYVVFILK